MAFVIVIVTLAAYAPTLRNGFIWDDDLYVTKNRTLRSLDGLRKIWFEIGSVPQYYPLVHTSFWIEYHLWGARPAGYHLVNVLLHACSAVLLGLVLSRLCIPGAWLAACVFALHPVHVESVAWVTERKNVLSGLLYLSALLSYLRFARPLDRRPWRYYALALFLFLCALLSKTVTCSMPAAVLLLLWWKRGRLTRRNLAATIPFFVLGLVLGLATAWMEKHHVNAQGPPWELSIVERCLIAGRALWFYAGKLVWPHRLTFIYPRWHIDAGAWWQYVLPVTAIAVVVTLWLGRRQMGRGPVAAILFFAGTLTPALGFFDVYPMRFSFVADHFQYLASIGLIALGAAGITACLQSAGSRVRYAAAGIVLAAFGVLVWHQCLAYRDAETVWRDTIAKNPGCPLAHYNLGVILLEREEHGEAAAHFAAVLEDQPEDLDGLNNLAFALVRDGRAEEAATWSRRALQLDPDNPHALCNLADALYRQGRTGEAIAHHRRALKLRPDLAAAPRIWQTPNR